MTKICLDKINRKQTAIHPSKGPSLFVPAAFVCVQPYRGFNFDVVSGMQTAMKTSAGPTRQTRQPLTFCTPFFFCSSLVPMIAAISFRAARVLIVALISSDIYSSPLCNINAGGEKKELREGEYQPSWMCERSLRKDAEQRRFENSPLPQFDTSSRYISKHPLWICRRPCTT